MQVRSAQLPDQQDSDDKLFTTRNAVIVLDGASAFIRHRITPSVYADTLGRRCQQQLLNNPALPLTDVLAEAIRLTVADHELEHGNAPCSTVAMVRRQQATVDVLVLGDTPVVVPGEVVLDDRNDHLGLPERDRYRARLAAGSGYDEEHKRLLTELQARHIPLRNREGGYWVADTRPEAAYEALTRRYTVNECPWVVIATDGAFNTLSHIGYQDWAAIADYSGEGLTELLQAAQRWEAETDPHGQDLPRSKRHDDKTMAVIQFGPAAT